MEQLFMISNMIGSIRLVDLQYTIGRRGYSYRSHRHTIFEFMYVISGNLALVMGGQPVTLASGDSLIIKPGIFHDTPPTKEDAEWFVFHFEVEDKRIHEILQLAPFPVIRKEEEESIHKFVRAFIDQYGYFLHHLGAKTEAGGAGESNYAAVTTLKVHASILNLISLLSDYFYQQTGKSGQAPHQPSLHPANIHLAHEAAYWIEKKANENIRIGDLAAQLNVDRSHLTNCFKKVYGQSPRSYLTQVKIRWAKGMLVDTGWSIEKIAQELQFSSSAHFVKFFLNAVGQTPLKFRNHSKLS